MITDFFRRLLQITALAAVVTVVYLDFIFVPKGYTTFLIAPTTTGGIDNQGVFQYAEGTNFVPTLFVPYRFQRYQLETQSKIQEIDVKLPLRYSAYLRLNDLFYVQLKIRIEGFISEKGAYAALKALQYKPTDRDKFIEKQLALVVAEYLLDIKGDEKNLEKTKITLAAFLSPTNKGEIQSRLNRQINDSWFTLTSVELKEIYMPDSALYAAQIRNLDEVATADRAALLSQISKEAELALERKRNLEDITKAEKMGALIHENPYILDYYKIEKIAPRAGNVMLDVTSNARHERPTPADLKDKRGRDGKNENSEGGEIGRAE
ncbi:MAG TPA: hypothetical protein PLY93_09065 [Turneriella sp.]|nr:hypothetical protein [Turneriella sp.]